MAAVFSSQLWPSLLRHLLVDCGNRTTTSCYRCHLLQQINTQQVICAGRSLIYVREVQAHSEEADIHPYVISVKLKVWESQQRK